jgi:hypothetical protein
MSTVQALFPDESLPHGLSDRDNVGDFGLQRFEVNDMLKSELFDAPGGTDEEARGGRKSGLIGAESGLLDLESAAFQEQTLQEAQMSELQGDPNVGAAHGGARNGGLDGLSGDMTSRPSSHHSSSSSPSSHSVHSHPQGVGAQTPSPIIGAMAPLLQNIQLSPNVDKLFSDIEALTQQKFLLDQLCYQTMDGITQCETALNAADISPSLKTELLTRHHELSAHFELKENELHQVRLQLGQYARDLAMLRQNCAANTPSNFIAHIDSISTNLDASLRAFASSHRSAVHWPIYNVPSAMHVSPPANAQVHMAQAPSFDPTWPTINVAPTEHGTRRYSEVEPTHFEAGAFSGRSRIPVTTHHPALAQGEYQRSRRYSMPEMGDGGFMAISDHGEYGMAHEPVVRRPTSRNDAVPRVTEVTMDANMVLVRPWIDDAASRYQTRLLVLPFLRDRNYPDDEDNPVYSVQQKEAMQQMHAMQMASEAVMTQYPPSVSSLPHPSQMAAMGQMNPMGTSPQGFATTESQASGGEMVNRMATRGDLPFPAPMRKRSRDDVFSSPQPSADDAMAANGGESEENPPPRSKRLSLAKHHNAYYGSQEMDTTAEGGGAGTNAFDAAMVPLSPPTTEEVAHSRNGHVQHSGMTWEEQNAGFLPSGAETYASPRSRPASEAMPVDLSDIAKPFSTASTLKPRYVAIAGWHEDASENMEILAKFHHSKKHLVWQFHDNLKGTGLKVLLNYSDVSSITVHDVNVASLNGNFVAINFSLNAQPKLFQEVPSNREHRNSKTWARVDAEYALREADGIPQVHTLIFLKSAFTDRHNNNISPFERLILGDPYFTRIVRLDSRYPPIGDGFHIIGRRTLEMLRDKLLHFFEMLHMYVSVYSMSQLSLSVNFDVHHTFKLADSSRLDTKAHENAIAINHEDIMNIARQRNEALITKDEIQYYMQITKIGENGICSFRHQGNVPTRATGKLDPRQLVIMSPHAQAAPSAGDEPEMEPTSPVPTVVHSHTPKRRRSSVGSKNGRGSEHPKNIRVAMMFSKARLVQVCGPEIEALWEAHSKSNERRTDF